MQWVNCRHFVLFMRFIYLLCGKLESVVGKESIHVTIQTSRNLEMACYTIWHSFWKL